MFLINDDDDDDDKNRCGNRLTADLKFNSLPGTPVFFAGCLFSIEYYLLSA